MRPHEPIAVDMSKTDHELFKVIFLDTGSACKMVALRGRRLGNHRYVGGFLMKCSSTYGGARAIAGRMNGPRHFSE